MGVIEGDGTLSVHPSCVLFVAAISESRRPGTVAGGQPWPTPWQSGVQFLGSATAGLKWAHDQSQATPQKLSFMAHRHQGVPHLAGAWHRARRRAASGSRRSPSGLRGPPGGACREIRSTQKAASVGCSRQKRRARSLELKAASAGHHALLQNAHAGLLWLASFDCSQP